MFSGGVAIWAWTSMISDIRDCAVRLRTNKAEQHVYLYCISMTEWFFFNRTKTYKQPGADCRNLLHFTVNKLQSVIMLQFVISNLCYGCYTSPYFIIIIFFINTAQSEIWELNIFTLSLHVCVHVLILLFSHARSQNNASTSMDKNSEVSWEPVITA